MQPIPVFLFERGVELGRLVMNAFTRAPVSDKREWERLTGRASERFTKSVIHNVTDGQFPLSGTALGLSQKVIINDQSGSHTYEHTYAKSNDQVCGRPCGRGRVRVGRYRFPALPQCNDCPALSAAIR